MERLFVYGTLKDEAVQTRLIGRAVELTPNTLKGYQISSLTPTLVEQSYLVIDPKPDQVVEGYTMEVSLWELIQIDEYEGNVYRRIRVTLRDGTAAWVYVRA
ncbi:MAG: gamma-glutamylcyclotransferase family protein [Phototrophicaceae bacterium]